ncbi:MAG TPA: glycosyltransferase family 2 protein [Blastocatellia bacterium]|nr:glycosyltransferase family 2 protein [Blastocatellia bacterium]
MNVWPRVSVIVLNWNTYAHTEACLESLRQITYPNRQVILVDNGSTDGSGEKLRRAFPEAVFLQNAANLGFARGCNVGIYRALADHSDYVLLLNSDMLVEPNFLEAAVRLAESDPCIGLVSGKVYLQDRPGVLWYAGGTVSAWRGVTVRGWYQKDGGQFDEPCEVGFSTGALMLIRRSVLDRIGLLPEVYFFGQEEWDYSLSVRRGGFKLYYAPQCVAYHKADGSHRNLDPKYLYNGFRNRIIFHSKFLPRPAFLLWEQVWFFYQRFISRWRLAHLDEATLRALPVAFRAAMRDHRRTQGGGVTEQDLDAFQNEFQRSCEYN